MLRVIRRGAQLIASRRPGQPGEIVLAEQGEGGGSGPLLEYEDLPVRSHAAGLDVSSEIPILSDSIDGPGVFNVGMFAEFDPAVETDVFGFDVFGFGMGGGSTSTSTRAGLEPARLTPDGWLPVVYFTTISLTSFTSTVSVFLTGGDGSGGPAVGAFDVRNLLVRVTRLI